MSARYTVGTSLGFAATIVVALVTAGLRAADVPVDEASADAPGPVEPADAEATFQLQPGFRIELVAAEPLVRDPISIEFDEDGAAYVIELPPYNQRFKPGSDLHGSIRRLVDVDGDGLFDESTVFADDLGYPTGLFCYDGGLFVGDSPYLLYLKDEDGDGRAERRETVLEGFGADAAGEGHLNSFRWGLDNRIVICTGIAGGDVRHADRPSEPLVPIRNTVLIFDPRTREFETMSTAGQFGMAIDDWGRIYVCDNSDPSRTVMYDDRYLARNPWMTAPAPTVSVTDGGKFTKLMRISQGEPWREVRTRLRVEKRFAGPDEGGEISGFFTAATGITVYRGDAWPEQFRGSLFTAEAANNLLYRANVAVAGLDVSAARADADAEFLASTDVWFRPAQLANAPDGTLYVIDMYRELIEGAQFLPPEVLAEMDPLAGSDRGRIYRILADGAEQRLPPQLSAASTAELVALLEHANGWHRDTAARLLYERRDPAIADLARRMSVESESPLGRMHALYVLAGQDALVEADVLAALADAHPGVRRHALKLAERLLLTPAPVQDTAARLADDSDVHVRYQAAFSLGSAALETKVPALLSLLRRDGASPWFRVAIQSSLGDGAGEMFARVLADAELRATLHGAEFLRALAQQIGGSQSDDDLTAALAALEPCDDAPLVAGLVGALLQSPQGPSREELAAHAGARVQEVLQTIFQDAVAAALDQSMAIEARIPAIALVGRGEFAAQRDVLVELMGAQQAPPIHAAALQALQQFQDGAVAETVLELWPTLTPELRTAAVELLCARDEWTQSLLSAIEAGTVAAAALDPARIALLKSHTDAAIREHSERVLAAAGPSPRAGVVAAYQPALEMAGDAGRGREVFRRACAACHQVGDLGTQVGADLKAIADQGPAATLLNILDPNREVKPKFLTYAVATADGRAVAGVIIEETVNSITLRGLDGASIVVPRADVEEISDTGLSYMPEGLEAQVTVSDMADLLAFLASAGAE
jgi:putative membrane-bound dehydrogenase-like protein